MKKKSQSTVAKTMAYLYDLAVRTPYPRLANRKSAEFVALARKHQYKLGRLKRTVCRKCHGILVLGVSCDAAYTRGPAGFGLDTACRACGHQERITLRGK